MTAALSLVSCAEWLDVNTDPENPTLESAEYQLELAHCEFYTNSAQQFAAWRSSMAMGDWTGAINRGTYSGMSYWAHNHNSLPVVPRRSWRNPQGYV